MELSLGNLRGSFASKLIITALLIAVGDFLFFQGEYLGAAFGVFGLCVLLGMASAMPSLVRDRRSRIALGIAALFAISIIYDASFLGWVMFTISAVSAVILPRIGLSEDGWQWLQRLLYQGLVAVIAPVLDGLRWLKARQKRGIRARSVRQILPIVFLPSVGTLIFVALFASANPVIDQWLSAIDLINIDVIDIARVMFWGVLGWFVWMLMRPHMPRLVFGTFEGRGDSTIPGVSPASVLLSLIMFNAVFALQNSMDAAWLWAGVSLPEEFTLAEYANRGAYPLIVTALLAGAFVLVALRPGSSTASMPIIRTLVALWVAQNVFLVFNASLRTLNYINAYSLTELRISALMWMALVALGLVLILWRMLSDKSTSWLINTNAAALGLMLTATCFVDLGAVAAGWNVRHAREIDGDGAVLDLCYLNQLGGSALLPLIELEQELESRGNAPELLYRVRNVREKVHTELQRSVDNRDTNWDVLGIWRLQAAKGQVGAAHRRGSDYYYDYNCDGSDFAPPVTMEPLLDEPALSSEGAGSEGIQEPSPDLPPVPPASEPERPITDSPDARYPAPPVPSSLTEGREE